MLRLINDFQDALDGPLTAAGETLPLSVAAAGELDFSNGGEYLLTLTDSLNLLTRTAMEIVRVSEGLAIQRGQEGTVALDWPANTIVMCAVTAGVMAELAPPTIVAATPPTFAPQVAGQQWIDGGLRQRYIALGSASVYDWRFDEPITARGPTEQISVMEESPAPSDLQPHMGVQLNTFPGTTNPLQQLNAAAMPALTNTRFDLLLQPSAALTVDLDCSLVEGTPVAGPYTSVEALPAGVTVSVVDGRVRIACTDSAVLRVEIYAGSDALGYPSGVNIALLPLPDITYIN